MTDNEYIAQALELAARGAAQVSPNPLVGSVVVSGGEVVGRGYHRYEELKHAEVWALEEAGERARGATVYVNLEPCSHQGEGKRTPPCVEALIRAGVGRVVASMVDPNPRVDGRGFEQLRAAGIEVTVGVGEDAARRLNEIYVKFVTTGLPFVHLKTACSLDGRIATRTGDSRWITGEEARGASQRLRYAYDAIMVGVGTVLADDPLLTDRTGEPRRRPLARIVLDSRLRIPIESNLVRTADRHPLLVFTSGVADTAAVSRLQNAGVDVIVTPEDDAGVDLTAVLREVSRRRLTSLIVEGGASVAGSFVTRRLVDKATFFIAPRIIGGKDSLPSIAGEGFASLGEALQLDRVELVRHGLDWEFTGYPK
ncbi:MAG: bifunctional diaminohydroxyphosphoribosylaminopyrimidine deaminase/5-amino-6-(5-phosphoribosylamino)uracil reductase RibD [Blastocatellales bacterium]